MSKSANTNHKKALRALEKGDMEALGAALTHRQRRFAEEYIIDYNGQNAAIRAGYSPKWADRQAHLLVINPGVQAYIDHLGRKKVDSIASVSPEYVIQKVTDTIDKAETTGNLTAVLRACELLARHLGMLKDKVEHSGPDGGAIELEQRIREESDDFLNKLRQLTKRSQNGKDEVEVTII